MNKPVVKTGSGPDLSMLFNKISEAGGGVGVISVYALHYTKLFFYSCADEEK